MIAGFVEMLPTFPRRCECLVASRRASEPSYYCSRDATRIVRLVHPKRGHGPDVPCCTQHSKALLRQYPHSIKGWILPGVGQVAEKITVAPSPFLDPKLGEPWE